MATIKTAPVYGEAPREIDVPASDMRGCYALHPFMLSEGPDPKRWTATHIPTGYCIGAHVSRAVALRSVNALVPITNPDTTDVKKVFRDFGAAWAIVRPARQKAGDA